MLATFRRILRFWRPHRALGAGLAITMVLRAVFTVVLALAIKYVIDAVVDPELETSVARVGAFLLGGFVVSLAAGLVAARLTARASADIIADVRIAAFEHLQSVPLGFHDRTAAGDLIAHFSSDISQLSRGVIRKPLIGLRALTAMALYLPVMILLDVRIAVVAVVAIPLAVYLVSRFAPESAPALDEEKQRIADVLDEVSTNLRSQKITRAYGLGDRSRRRFAERIEALRAASERAEGRIAYEMVIAEYAIELTKVAIIVLAAAFAFSGSLDPGSFAALAAIVIEFAYQASVFGMDVLPSIKQSDAGIRRLDALLRVERLPAPEATLPTPRMCSPLAFRDVVFRYHTDGEAQLRQLSMDLPAESFIAVVGPNGSGKSSLLNVLLGLYQVESGVIEVDGVDVRAIDPDDLRRNVGVAFQDTVLFESTLHDNIGFGLSEYTDADVARAIGQSGLDRVVAKLPDGGDSRIGPGGVSLSAGEAQRVGLARALLREPQLLLLDEVASGLDPESESALMEVIEELRPGRTIVAVTHRLESVRTADLIVVVDGGHVVEKGSFDDLLAADGQFSHMWEKQHGFDVSANGLSARVRPERLRGIPLFAELDDDVLGDLATSFASQLFDHGEVVFREGDVGDSFYVIARGVVEVVRGAGTPEERTVAYLEDGDFFGEMALLDSQRRNATVRVRGATTLLRLDRSQFRQLMETVPEARRVIEEAAARRATENAS